MSQVLSLAKEFVKLSLSGDECDPLTNLRLQKLLYYAQAWSLVIRASELFPEEIVAWRHGPVVLEVYHAFPNVQGANCIALDSFADTPDLEAEDATFVRSVWESYHQHSATKLSQMTHAEMPWQKAWGDPPKNGTGNEPIQVEDLEEFFGKQAVPAPLAAFCHAFRKREEEATRKLMQLPPLDLDRLKNAVTSFTPAARRLLSVEG